MGVFREGGGLEMMSWVQDLLGLGGAELQRKQRFLEWASCL